MSTEPLQEPSVWGAIGRGVMGRCPRCGKGKLFHGFLTQVDACDTCGEPMARYNVGLFLPLIVITIAIHILAFIMLDIELNGGASPGTYLMVLVPAAIILPLALMRPTKGAIIGFLWSSKTSDEQG